MKKAVEECTRRDEQVAILTKEKLAAEKRCNQVNITIHYVRLACKQVMLQVKLTLQHKMLHMVIMRLCVWVDMLI